MRPHLTTVFTLASALTVLADLAPDIASGIRSIASAVDSRASSVVNDAKSVVSSVATAIPSEKRSQVGGIFPTKTSPPIANRAPDRGTHIAVIYGVVGFTTAYIMLN
jgi:hypothetical protein